MAEQFCARVAKDCFGPCIDQGDFSFGIRYQHGVGRTLHHGAPAFLGLFERINVSRAAHVSSERAIGHEARRARIKNPGIIPILFAEPILHRELTVGIERIFVRFFKQVAKSSG